MGKMAERVSDASSHNLFPSYPVVCFEKMKKGKWGGGTGVYAAAGLGSGGEGGETNGPIAVVKHY